MFPSPYSPMVFPHTIMEPPRTFWESVPQYIINHPTDAAAMKAFLESCSGKHIKFPRGMTFELDNYVWLNMSRTILSKAIIDFNYCVFRNSDHCPWLLTNNSKPLIYFYYVADCIFENYIVDGNKDNNAGKDEYGIQSYSCYNVQFNNCLVRDITHHAVYNVGHNSNVIFNYLDIANIYGFASAAEIYSESNTTTDRVEFRNITMSRDSYISNQAFYLNNLGTVIIDTVNASNIAGFVIDIRAGSIFAKNVTADHCGGMIIAQPYTSAAKFHGSNFIGTNFDGRAGVSDVIRILRCNWFELDGCDVTSISDSIRSIRFSPTDAIAIGPVAISNYSHNGFSGYGIDYTTLATSTHLRNITLIPGSPTAFILNAPSTTAKQYVENLTAGVPNGGNSDPHSMLVVT